MKKLILFILLISFISCGDDSGVKIFKQQYPDYSFTEVEGEIFVVTDFHPKENYYRGYFLKSEDKSHRSIGSQHVKPHTDTNVVNKDYNDKF